MRKKVIFKGTALPWLLLLPQLVITGVFFFWPAGQAIYSSFLREDAFGLSRDFVGLENFVELQEGRAWAFDDSIEHEAVNESEGARVMLVFDIARPDITAAEHRDIATLLEGVDAFTGQPPGWEI